MDNENIRAHHRKRVLILAVVLVVVATVIVYRYIPSAARRALPESAREVQEFYDTAFGGDYVRCIKAKLPEADFPVYARNLGLRRSFISSEHEGRGRRFVNIQVSWAPAWWDPPRGEPGIDWYYDQDPNVPVNEDLTWSNGYVYYLAFSW